MNKQIILLCALVLSLGLNAQIYYPPNSGSQWDTISPQSLGWCSDQIPSLYSFLDTNQTKAFLVLKDGKIVIEKYFGTFSKDSIWYWASAGKTLTSLCIGIANQEGKLKLADTSSRYLGKGWTSMTSSQEDKVTIWHQLTMSSGMIDTGVFFDCTAKNCLKFKADAGTRWAYHNAPYTLLDSVIESATGQSLNSFINSKIKPNTGITGSYIPSGFNNVFFSTPRSMARFGLLLLSKGVWNGLDILKDSNYFKSMTNSSQSINKSYGYLTWLNGKESYMLPGIQTEFSGPLCPDAPANMYAALGKNGQIINVVPSSNLVIIRMGNMWTTSNVPNTFNNDIWKKLNTIICPQTLIILNNIKETNVFPNPTSQFLKINTINLGFNYEILNMYGKKIQQNKIENDLIDVHILNQGMYLLQIFDQNQNLISKSKFYKIDK